MYIRYKIFNFVYVFVTISKKNILEFLILFILKPEIFQYHCEYIRIPKYKMYLNEVITSNTSIRKLKLEITFRGYHNYIGHSSTELSSNNCVQNSLVMAQK